MNEQIKALYSKGSLTVDGLVDALLRNWITDQEVIELLGETEGLNAIKAARIKKSNTDLEKYLESHPIQWTDGAYYSITSEKQQRLTSKIMRATMAKASSTEYNLTWNSTGEVCKSWTLEDLTALGFAIDARVTALVTYQQSREVSMRNAETLEALDAIVVDYDSV